MSLENANGIWQLIITNPTSSDFVSQGDDHFRMFKGAVVKTFPNIKGVVQISHTDLNNIPQNLTQKIEALMLASCPQGAILGWDVVNKGTVLPAGWAWCNGQTIEGYGVVPDMRNLHVKGAGSMAEAGTIGGADSSTTSGAPDHTHTGASGPATLTESQLPVVTLSTKGSFTAGGYDGGNNSFFRIQLGDLYNPTGIIQSFGGGQPHSHPGAETSAAGAHTHTVSFDPRHYKMIWIVKTSALVLP
jgi:hypothetical protein